MFEQEFIKTLKQTNISKEGEKTKARVNTIWQALNKEQKSEILTLADISRATVYRISSTGSISAKLVIPISQTANVDPYYLIGLKDDAGSYNYQTAVQFLTELGYEKILTEYEKGQKWLRRKEKKQTKADKQNTAASQPAGQEAAAPATSEEAPVNDVQQTTYASVMNQTAERNEKSPEVSDKDAPEPTMNQNLIEDEMILLLRAVLLRAKAGVVSAINQSNKIKKILLS